MFPLLHKTVLTIPRLPVTNVLQRKKRPSEAKPRVFSLGQRILFELIGLTSPVTPTHISSPRPLTPVPPSFSIPSLVRLISHTMTEPSNLRSICRRLPPLPACPKDWDISSPIRLQEFSPVVILFAQLWALKQNYPVPETFFDALHALYQYLGAVDKFIQTAHPLDAKTVYNYLPPAVKLHACRTEFITGYLERLHRRVGVARALKEDFHSRLRESGVEQTREWVIQKRRNEATKTRCRVEKLLGRRPPRNLYDAVRDRNCCVVARSHAGLAEWERWHNRTRALEEWVDGNIRLETKCMCLSCKGTTHPADCFCCSCSTEYWSPFQIAST